MIDLTNLLAPYENKWVALAEDEKDVLASGDDIQQVYNIIEGKKLKATYMFVHSFSGVFAPRCAK